jgi:hypothetical protein
LCLGASLDVSTLIFDKLSSAMLGRLRLSSSGFACLCG